MSKHGVLRTARALLSAAIAVLSFLTTVLCMRDVLAARDELAAGQEREG
ncbi:MAG TPA: hypothetical protein IAC53_00405 [Candidatus Fimenecus excrementigallinarum]|uniref:Uncharacterized protein n=1 Tax=Candidatus Fimenecus excrementigallinarum TaxID=2840816 RepID=A0A9D1LCW2_9FIRM|nr:hypothetical protein [Candidatus Fimenecus excrementigallinarum]